MNKAFTLIEFLIYIGIVGTIVIAASAIAFNIFFVKAKIESIEAVSQNARISMERIANRIRNAEAINSPAPGTSVSTLSLQMADAAYNPTIFDVSGTTLRIQEGAAQAVNLTSSQVLVTNLQFSNISYTDTPGTVRAQMTVRLVNPGNRQEYDFEKTFYTTTNIRKK